MPLSVSPFTIAVVTVAAVSVHLAAFQAVSPDTAVERVGDYVERYYARAQSIVVDENVIIQPLGLDLRGDGFARRLTYELRVEWTRRRATRRARQKSRGSCWRSTVARHGRDRSRSASTRGLEGEFLTAVRQEERERLR